LQKDEQADRCDLRWEENKGRSVVTVEKLYLVLSEGTALALAVRRPLHIASPAVLMLNLQLAVFMYCLMKNLGGNLQEEVELLSNYSHFCRGRESCFGPKS